MLRYVGYGHRDWRTAPMPKHRRVNWEFLATLSGTGISVTDQGNSAAVSVPTLWLFPPEVSHGWASEDPAGAEVAIFHFSGLDPYVEQIVRREGALAVSLTAEDVTVLRELGCQLWSHYWKPTVLGGFHADRALATLCLIALRDHPECQRPVAPKAAVSAVEAAERWILNHLSSVRAVGEAAKAVGISRPQLDRLIRQIRGCSSSRLLLRLRFEAAKRLMSESDLKLDSIARECGFSDASAFCRAFRSAHGCSPTKWREEYHICYRQPPPELRSDPDSHNFPPAIPVYEWKDHLAVLPDQSPASPFEAQPASAATKGRRAR